MHYCDLHCDTATAIYNNDSSIVNNRMHISEEEVRNFKHYVQHFAFFIPDEIKGEARWNYFYNAYNYFIKQITNSKISLCKNYDEIMNCRYCAVVTVENSGLLNGDISRVSKLSEFGVKLMSITWNGENEAGYGVGCDINEGLSEFGKAMINEMERFKIIPDVSHLNEKGFYDVASRVKNTFIASHSNSKSVCSHKRNLTDEQFCSIMSKKGLVGINLFPDFLNNDCEKASVCDIIKHIEHFLALGGENVLALGADFDGVSYLPENIYGIKDIGKLKKEMIKLNYSQEIIDKIYYKNFLDFAKRNYI